MARKVLKGVVIRVSDVKTAIVKVERAYPHPIYDKIIKKHKNYKVDMGKIQLKIDDKVEIEECRPISKDKHFKVKQII